MPGRTKCPTCGRPYPLPSRVCEACDPSKDVPPVPVLLEVPSYRGPSSKMFRPSSWSWNLIWVLVVTLLFALSTLTFAVAMASVSP